jgi:hypothetical protein
MTYIEARNLARPSFAWLFFGKVVLLFVTILVVWAIYAYWASFTPTSYQ